MDKISRFMKSFALILLYGLLLPYFSSEDTIPTPQNIHDDVSIEITEGKSLGFDFKITYLEWRNQIHVRSAQAIRTMELSKGGKVVKSYNIIGSELVILPMTDFSKGSTHDLKIEFINSEQVVKADITVKDIDHD